MLINTTFIGQEEGVVFKTRTYALQHSMLILVHLIQQSLQIFSTAAGGRESNQKETNFNPQMLMEYHLSDRN